jgi:hypothetical protein
MSVITSKELLERAASDPRVQGAVRVKGRDRFPPVPKCKPGECVCLDVTFGNAGFWVYRCVKCGAEEWL